MVIPIFWKRKTKTEIGAEMYPGAGIRMTSAVSNFLLNPLWLYH